MNEDKIIRIFNDRVPIRNIKHWQYDESLDKPEFSELNQKRFDAVKSVQLAWTILGVSPLRPMLAPNFKYYSAWVDGSIDGSQRYLGYLTGKFETIRKSGADPKMEVVVIREALYPQQYSYALHLTQGDIQTILTVKFEEDKIVQMKMDDPDCFTFELVK